MNPIINIEPGIYQDLSIDQYHGEDGFLSSTRMKPMFESLRAFFTYKPTQEKKAHFDIGNAFELYLIDRHEFNKSVVIFDESQKPVQGKDYRVKENKLWKDSFFSDNVNKYIITRSDFDMIKIMVDNVRQNRRANMLVEESDSQYSYFWEHETGIRLKSRPDLVKSIDEKNVVITDIKSTLDGSMEGFVKQSEKLHYPWQAITQIKALESFGYNVVAYYWLVCEKNYFNPYTELYRFHPRHIEIMSDIFDKKMNSLSEAFLRGEKNLWWYSGRDVERVPYLGLNYYYFTKIDEQ